MGMSINWLHKDGDWYLLSKEQCKDMEGYDYNFFVWHSCQQGTTSYGGCWRVTRHNLNLSCGACQERCPEGMQALWLMMNADIQGD
jgi:hypothetical protein